MDIQGGKGADDGGDEFGRSALEKLGRPVQDEAVLVTDTVCDADVGHVGYDGGGGSVHKGQGTGVVWLGEGVMV